MGLILDSSLVIAAERFGKTAYQMLEEINRQIPDPEVGISVITVLELAHGVVRANTVQRWVSRQRFLDDLLTGMPIHPITVGIALRAGQIDGQLMATGKSFRWLIC